MNVKYTYCDHFTTHTNIKSLCRTPEINTTLNVNHISIKRFNFKLQSTNVDTSITSKIWMTLCKVQKTRQGQQPVRDILAPLPQVKTQIILPMIIRNMEISFLNISLNIGFRSHTMLALI